MPTEAIDTNCMTLTRWILAEQKKYAPPGQSSGKWISCERYGVGQVVGYSEHKVGKVR